MPRRLLTVDVFTDRPLSGNPVAVVLDAEDLDETTMRAVARWTNLSETTFVLPPTVETADYRLRIFTPGGELPFAGHPTIGSAHAVLGAGVVTGGPALVQECAAGLISVTVEEDGWIWFEVPAALMAPSAASEGVLTDVLGGVEVVDARLIDVGARWVVARLADGASMDRISVDHARLAILSRTHGWTGLTVYAIDGENLVEVRSFAPAHGVPEDPVCGSGNAAVGVHLHEFGLSDRVGVRYLATQGRFVGRDGRISVRVGDRVSVGGKALTVVTGTLDLG